MEERRSRNLRGRTVCGVCAWGCRWRNGSVLILGFLCLSVVRRERVRQDLLMCPQGSHGTSEVTCAFH